MRKRRQLFLFSRCLRHEPPLEGEKAQATLLIQSLPTPRAFPGRQESAGNSSYSVVAYATSLPWKARKRRQLFFLSLRRRREREISLITRLFPACSALRKTQVRGNALITRLFPACSALKKTQVRGNALITRLFPARLALKKTQVRGNALVSRLFPACLALKTAQVRGNPYITRLFPARPALKGSSGTGKIS